MDYEFEEDEFISINGGRRWRFIWRRWRNFFFFNFEPIPKWHVYLSWHFVHKTNGRDQTEWHTYIKGLKRTKKDTKKMKEPMFLNLNFLSSHFLVLVPHTIWLFIHFVKTASSVKSPSISHMRVFCNRGRQQRSKEKHLKLIGFVLQQKKIQGWKQITLKLIWPT